MADRAQSSRDQLKKPKYRITKDDDNDDIIPEADKLDLAYARAADALEEKDDAKSKKKTKKDKKKKQSDSSSSKDIKKKDKKKTKKSSKKEKQ